MEFLPDHVLHKILQIGIKTRRLNHIDLCSLAIVNSRFDQLTQDPSLWAILLSRRFNFSSISFQVPAKTLYRIMHEQCFEKTRLGMELKQWHIHLASLLDETSYGSSPQIGLSQWATHVTKLSLHLLEEDAEDAPSLLSYLSDSCSREENNLYYEKKPSKRFDKSSKSKVIPMSKSFTSIIRPQRRSVPRKI